MSRIGPTGRYATLITGRQALMRIVLESAAEVTRALDAGELRCTCGPGRLRRWGWARPRVQRSGRRLRRIRPRRARCRTCGRTHVLLPATGLLRRLDEVTAIGGALVHASRGIGTRRIANALGVPRSTVRDWIRAFRRSASHRPGAPWSPGWAAAPPDWRHVSVATGGRLLCPVSNSAPQPVLSVGTRRSAGATPTRP